MKNWIPYPWQLNVWDALHQQIVSHHLPHALLVVGEVGIGKRHFVDVLLAKLLCFEKKEIPCGVCKSCLLLAAGSHPGFLKIGVEEKSSVIKVDQIRVLVDFVMKTAQIGDVKVAVIETAEAMNVNAANSLLKSLEEPSNNTHIILITHAPHRLLPTIRSRCRLVDMPKPIHEQADKWLATFINDANERQQLMILANNNPLLAMQYADMEVVSLFNKNIEMLIGLANASEITAEAAKIEKQFDISLWLFFQQKVLSQLIRASMQIVELPQHLQSFSILIQKPSFNKHAFKMLDEVQQSIKETQHNNPNTILLVESLLIRWQALLRV